MPRQVTIRVTIDDSELDAVSVFKGIERDSITDEQLQQIAVTWFDNRLKAIVALRKIKSICDTFFP